MTDAKQKTTLLSATARTEIDTWLAKFPDERKQSAVIAGLTAVQNENGGSLTNELMDAVAEYLDIPSIAAYEVATFYSMFDLEPVGRHKISVCTNISCMLCGGEKVVEHISGKLGVKLGETTADGKFTLNREEECLAACAGAPMMVVDGHYHENLTPEKIDAILDGLE
jgi:NADH-quinone oxidoreductase subunit E